MKRNTFAVLLAAAFCVVALGVCSLFACPFAPSHAVCSMLPQCSAVGIDPGPGYVDPLWKCKRRELFRR